MLNYIEYSVQERKNELFLQKVELFSRNIGENVNV
jgi:hypothetical protein